MLAYACVYSFYNQDTEHMDVVEQQTENLELHTNALQILLGEARPRLASPFSCPPLPSERPIPTDTQVDETAPPSSPASLCPLTPPA